MALPRSVALTFEDMEAMPDDGHRYELIHGALLVTPAPFGPHEDEALRSQIVSPGALRQELRATRPVATPRAAG